MDLMVFGALLVGVMAAGISGMLFQPGNWYTALRKPSWTPPPIAFPIAWTVLYLLMCVAGARVAGKSGADVALAFMAGQLAVNVLWTPVFFGLHRIRIGMGVIILLWLMVLGTLVLHWRIDWLAGLMLVPYLVWLTYAAALNLMIIRLNPFVVPIDPGQLRVGESGR
ncbi:tryptophan-rich sensory protein TspO [Ketogulonicigenium vulgare]|nr:TspO/MBR family protein [Ketogulonicigenium vulgare]ADO41669.1 protein CrtK [Ketogulonicigenium vulgare Y25]ALJ80124.1 sensory protein TspO [Ketogulonicigenium vulgare]ANW32992.1 sensory protein TspO [Ketogulonicigenium vulgare]AOZ53601.1 TspO and MBR-like protein [Ketogulonicigenium vulgare]